MTQVVRSGSWVRLVRIPKDVGMSIVESARHGNTRARVQQQVAAQAGHGGHRRVRRQHDEETDAEVPALTRARPSRMR